MAKYKKYSIDWLLDIFGSMSECKSIIKGSNVIEVSIDKLENSAFSEGGVIRMIMYILADSNGRVNLCRVKKEKNGVVRYRLSVRSAGLC